MSSNQLLGFSGGININPSRGIGFLDGSASAIKLTRDGTIPAPNGDPNIFKIDDIVEDENIEVLNPLKRRRAATSDE